MAKQIIALLVAALAGAACSGTAAAPDGGASTGADSPSGVVIGPLDSHCTASDGGLTIQPVGVCQVIDPTTVPANAASCNVSFSMDGGAAAGDSDGGVATSDYGPTMYGSAADDDDCKYFVSWTATPIKENADTYLHGHRAPPGRHDARQLRRRPPGRLAQHQPRRARAAEPLDGDRPRRLQGRPDQVRRARDLDRALSLLRGVQRRARRIRRTVTPPST